MSTRTTNDVSKPGFFGDPSSIVRLNGGRQVAWPLISEDYRDDSFEVTLAAAVALGATSMTVQALPKAVPAGTLLYFGEAGETVRVTTDAAAGDTTLAIDPAPTGIESGDTATVEGSGELEIPAGTVMVEVAGGGYPGKGVPRAIRPGGEEATYLIESMANKNDGDNIGYGAIVGGAIVESWLPEATGTPRVLSGTYKTELKANGTGFVFETYSDSRAL